MKSQILLVGVLLGVFMSVITEAKVLNDVRNAFEAKFVPAIKHRALETAAEELEMAKLKSFVVVEKDGIIPAERAYYLIGPGEYDYRGATIEGDTVKTRRGRIYTHLSRGTVMAVVGVVYLGRHIYLKLLSLSKIKSDSRPELKPTCVTVMLGFKFDEAVLQNAEMDKIFSIIESWVRPFSTYQEALNYSGSPVATPHK